MKSECSYCEREFERKTVPTTEFSYCSRRCQLKHQYALGVRDGIKITQAAHKKLREEGHYKRDNTYLKGENNHGWVGGKILAANGYIRVRHNNDYVLEHRKVWEDTYGIIPNGFQIHHKNGIKTDNRIENLTLLSNTEHQKLHYQERVIDDKGRFTREAKKQ